MKFGFATLILFLLTTPAAAQHDNKRGQWEQEARHYLMLCVEQPKLGIGTCAQQEQEFIANYILAYHGEFIGQTNTASCLQDGCDGLVFVNKVQSCAWRMVLARGGHSEYRTTDAERLRHGCGRLSPTELDAAKDRSERITKEIVPIPRSETQAIRENIRR